MKKYVTIMLMVSCWLSLSLLSAYAEKKETADEAALKKRIEERMQAAIAEKWDAVYPYFDSNYRKEISKEKFIYKPRNVKFKKYVIESLNILPSEKEADVMLKMDVEFQGYTFPNAPKKQRWIKEEGQWFLKEETKKPNPFSSASQPKKQTPPSQKDQSQPFKKQN